MIIHAVQKIAPLRKFVCRLGENRARFLISFFEDQLPKKAKILDVGAGVCNISRQLSQNGHSVTPLDIQNLSMVSGLDPLLYDGGKIPFKDNTYDVGLLVTVLHHVVEAEYLFDETVRVSKKVVVIEDVYDSWLHKRLTFFFDSLLNLEFIGHPHNNKTDNEWKLFFAERGLKLVSERAMGSYLVFRHKVYVLDTRAST